MFRVLFIFILVLLQQAVLMPAGYAQGLVEKQRHRGDEGERRDRQRGISLDQAVQMVQRRYKARAVKAETTFDGDRRIYVIRLLNDSGRVWTVRVDAETGSMR
jgi:uncharacterized membrane protein YkoI